MTAIEKHGVTQIYKGGPLRDHLLAQVADAVRGLDVAVRVVQVGDNPGSNAYVARKMAACAQVGIASEMVRLDAAQGEAELHAVVRRLAADPAITALIVQTPLPAGWDAQAALDLVPTEKDIDGLSRASAELRRAGDAAALLPATPLGVMRLMEAMGLAVAGAKICVIGKGMVVGAPLREMLTAAGAEVAGIEKDTANPAALCRACDVVVAAAGAPGLVKADWLKPGAAVIDVGITRVDGKLLGDVDRAHVEGTARVVTPVPGGVGPMTVASLLTNIADAACMQLGRPRVRWMIDGCGYVAE